MSKHTPGPWQSFYKAKYDEWHVSIPMADSTMRFALFDDGVRSANPEADARLIAAAPDLLAILQKIAASTFYVPTVSVLRAEMDAAIAAATGEKA